MPETVNWLDDGSAGGTPYSPRFGDRYRSELGGLEQARDVFFKGCGLPEAWAGQAQWRILETGFGLGLNFLVTWQAWREDPRRPRMLHFVSSEAFPASAADILRSAAAHPSLLPLARELQDQFEGLLPGFHRLSFDKGRVLLTLCIGDAKAMLKQQHFEADSVYLDGFSPQKNPDIWDIHTLKAVARCCRRGTRIATWTIARGVRDGLAEAGFSVRKTPGIPPKRDNLQGEYAPAWEPGKSPSPLGTLDNTAYLPAAAGRARTCIVIGGGLAGAAAAASLARRGWEVTVLDAADRPAAGASGLPAGLAVPHVSPDDAPVSRLSRAGLRLALREAAQHLATGADWQPGGVLEHLVGSERLPLPASWQDNQAAQAWSQAAASVRLAAAGLPPDVPALWHGQGAWIKPARLVQAWLGLPGIRWRGNCAVTELARSRTDKADPAGTGLWQALGPGGELHAAADIVVLAAAFGNLGIRAGLQSAGSGQPVRLRLKPGSLQALRGQLSWAMRAPGDETAFPAFPVNGHGSLIPAVPLGGGTAWLVGSSFERDESRPLLKAGDDADNLDKMSALLPGLAAFARTPATRSALQSWAGVRCATATRLPMLGPLAFDAVPGAPPDEAKNTLWISSGMGSRGLTFAALCGELLAARLHGEPLPVEQRLAQALSPPAMVIAP